MGKRPQDRFAELSGEAALIGEVASDDGLDILRLSSGGATAAAFTGRAPLLQRFR